MKSNQWVGSEASLLCSDRETSEGAIRLGGLELFKDKTASSNSTQK